MVAGNCRFCKAALPDGVAKCRLCGSEHVTGARQRWAHLVEDYVLNHFISTGLPPEEALVATVAYARVEDPELVRGLEAKKAGKEEIALAFLAKHFSDLRAEWLKFKIAEPQLPLVFGTSQFRRMAVQLRESIGPAKA